MMRDLDPLQLLAMWYRAEQASEISSLGYPHECPSTRGFRATEVHDGDNGADDSRERFGLVERISFVIDGMPQTYRIALQILARNQALGLRVWSSPRLPEDETERRLLTSEALALFVERL